MSIEQFRTHELFMVFELHFWKEKTRWKREAGRGVDRCHIDRWKMLTVFFFFEKELSDPPQLFILFYFMKPWPDHQRDYKKMIDLKKVLMETAESTSKASLLAAFPLTAVISYLTDIRLALVS